MTESNRKKPDKSANDRRFVITFLIQCAVCAVIIASVIITKYASPKTFVAASSALKGIYSENITLKDLTAVIDEQIQKNDAMSVFFHGGAD
ncbi:hypothetical protein FACS1894105_03360 [Clostridia bacterium]|nr:hypothetical protein FACS1894105_03360 [Clostridia bacterium]